MSYNKNVNRIKEVKIMYEEVKNAIYERIKDDLTNKPKTKEEINNPMKKDKKEELYNAIYCYDENDTLCGYNIQVRIAENDIYKYRFYIPIVDSAWKNVKKPEDLPDKKVKIGFDGEYVSQNELLKKNDLKLANAMYLNFNTNGVINLGEGFFGIVETDVLYLIVRGFKFYGYPVNLATKELNSKKLFV